MAAELQLQSPNGTSFGMWNNNNNSNNNNKVQVQLIGEDEDDSWEVRAFEEDITAGNQMGCTWPPRSYTCNFCRREFRSAQALGGHMNVHRRDRARLHQQPLVIPPPPTPSSNDFPNSSTILVPNQEFLQNGLCLFYSLPNPNGVFTKNSPSANDHLSVSPNYPRPPTDMSAQNSNKTEPSSFISDDNIDEGQKDSAIEELDLELRLGCGLPTP